jgi:hypothetical protein
VTERDVLFTSFPKSGTTWLSFMLSDLIWSAGDRQEITDPRFMPGVGQQHLGECRLPNGGWLLRTHERYRPVCQKAIYVVRDGRDVAASMYFHVKRATGMEAEFSEFLQSYLTGYFTGPGSWHDHVFGWLDSPCFARGDGLLVRYEDMKENVERELRRCAEFLQIETTPERIQRAAKAGSFETMQKTEQRSQLISHREKGETIPFVRKGITGDWQNHFSEHDLKRFEAVAWPAMERLGYADSMAPNARDSEPAAASPSELTTLSAAPRQEARSQ